MKKIEIELKSGIDPLFFDLLNKLYKPMLSSSHLNDKFKFTIFSTIHNYPLGIISINKGKNTFMQFALIPEVRGQGLAQEALKKIIEISGVKRVDWGCKKINYPSLKILYDFQGGIFDNVIKNKNRKSYEGYFRVGKPVSRNMYENLKSVLPESKLLFIKWFENEYLERKNELEKLNKYLKEYSNENN